MTKKQEYFVYNCCKLRKEKYNAMKWKPVNDLFSEILTLWDSSGNIDG